MLGLEAEYSIRHVMICELAASMILAEDVSTKDGRLLIARGYQLSESMLRHLENFARRLAIREPICVLVPVQKASNPQTAEPSTDRPQTTDDVVSSAATAERAVPIDPRRISRERCAIPRTSCRFRPLRAAASL